MFKNKYSFFFGLFLCLFLASCSSSKSLSYFDDHKNDMDFAIPNETLTYPILKGEVLYLSVNSADLLSNAVFNSVNNAGGLSVTPLDISASPGYLVEEDGTLTFPKLGRIMAAGKTRANFKIELEQALTLYLKDPIITIRNLSFTITVLGEVTRPGSYNTQRERMTLLEAIGKAGDLTVFGKRENVLLIREKDQQQQYHRINLNDRSSITSEYYYLRPNDVIYVEPLKSKKFAGSNFSQFGPLIFTSLSLLISALFYFK